MDLQDLQPNAEMRQDACTGKRQRLADIPPELSDLNELETRLISLRIPFMKIVSLATGQQKKISGPAINVPTDLKPVCRMLQCLLSQTQLVTMKLKRKLGYKTYHYQRYVRPDKVMVALRWLKNRNKPLCKH